MLFPVVFLYVFAGHAVQTPPSAPCCPSGHEVVGCGVVEEVVGCGVVEVVGCGVVEEVVGAGVVEVVSWEKAFHTTLNPMIFTESSALNVTFT